MFAENRHTHRPFEQNQESKSTNDPLDMLWLLTKQPHAICWPEQQWSFPSLMTTASMWAILTKCASVMVWDAVRPFFWLIFCLCRPPESFDPTFWHHGVRWGLDIILSHLGIVSPRHQPEFCALVWVQVEKWCNLWLCRGLRAPLTLQLLDTNSKLQCKAST